MDKGVFSESLPVSRPRNIKCNTTTLLQAITPARSSPSMSVEEVIQGHLKGLDDDLMSYIVSILEDMSLDERKSNETLQETISPFLLDSGFCDSEEDATTCCKKISVSFGGSGYKSSGI